MAFAFTTADFILVFPEFAALPDAQVQIFENIAKGYITEGIFGVRAQYALMLYTAHLLELNVIRRGKSGATEMEKVGDLTRKFTTPKNPELNSTQYGLQLRELQKAMGLNFLYIGGTE